MTTLSYVGDVNTHGSIPETTSQHDFILDLANEQCDDIEDEGEKLSSSYTLQLTGQRPFRLSREAPLLLKISMPAVAVQLSVLFIFPQTASAVGKTLGTEELAGFSLASLTGNLTILSVIVGVLTAADTLMPRAYGTAHYADVGRLAIRAIVMSTLLLIPPVVPLVVAMNWVFDKLGQDPIAAALASEWIRAYLLCVPALLVFRVCQSFLNAQHIVMPLVFVSIFSCFVIHPVILRVMLHFFGFIGSGLAVAFTNTAMAALILIYLKVKPEHEPQTWPGLSWSFFREAISPGPVLEFLKLGLGGVLTLSEWWFWECSCFIVGTMGVVPLCIHTIAYNLVPLLFMIPLGISIGLTVRMGHVLARDVPRAKQMAIWCMGFTVLVGAIVAALLYHLRIPIVILFTDDDVVLEGCVKIWPRVCCFVFILYIFGINVAIHRALGLQWRMAAVIFVCLWCILLPAMLYFAIFRGGGLDAVWTILPLGYSLMQVLLTGAYMTADWQHIGNEIRKNARKNIANAKETAATEVTSLIS